MMKILTVLWFAFFPLLAISQDQDPFEEHSLLNGGALNVNVIDYATGNSIPNANVKVYLKKALVKEEACDSTGSSAFNLDQGTYSIVCRAGDAYQATTAVDVKIIDSKVTIITLKLKKK